MSAWADTATVELPHAALRSALKDLVDDTLRRVGVDIHPADRERLVENALTNLELGISQYAAAAKAAGGAAPKKNGAGPRQVA